MSKPLFSFICVIAVLVIVAWPAYSQCCGSSSMSNMDCQAMSQQHDMKEPTAPAPGQLSEAGQKIKIGEECYFTYRFAKKPKMGTSILRVQVYTKDGKPCTAYRITGHSGMPSMGNAHDVLDTFKLNKDNVYLLPVDFVMPGVWRINLSFLRDTSTVFTGWFNQKI
ncbi:FixH family protein [candidate division TA06 bacterium]|uniref:FixH family protein n=1 Tax=candidate division TA06 bacterium TaxID=2250710 RepID=A0A933IA16_UNCT6|nr:FixH family protein [candidate division TA06 bacterium]